MVGAETAVIIVFLSRLRKGEKNVFCGTLRTSREAPPPSAALFCAVSKTARFHSLTTNGYITRILQL